MRRSSKKAKDGLIAILKEKSDFTILQEQGWYRIPVVSAPKRWPPKWMAFYQPRYFKDDAYKIRYHGQVKDIQLVKRKDLFPNELPSTLSEREYYKIRFEKLEELANPIPSYRPRRIVFIPTTREKFENAEQINDLFDDSPLEDQMWKEMKHLSLGAERQWNIRLETSNYFLDFAIFCKNGQIDVETDGDFWHINPEKAPKDNLRDNALQINGWTVLRFNTKQIKENLNNECMHYLQQSINNLGGLCDDGIIPRIFYTQGENYAQQFSLFDEDDLSYSVD